MATKSFSEKDKQLISVSATLGIFGIALFIAVNAICIWQNPWFSITDNALSDLGVIGVYPWMFSAGMIGTGVCVIGFSAGLHIFLPQKMAPSSIGFVLGGIGLVGVGVFPNGALHVAAVLFMLICFALSLLFMVWHHEHARESNIAAFVFVVSLSAVFGFMIVSGFAIPEVIIAAALGGLVLLYSVKMAAVSNYLKG